MQFLKRQETGLEKETPDFVRHCGQCQWMNLQTPNYVQLHLEIPKMPMTLITMDFIGPFQVTSKENKYALTVICFLTI